MSSHHPNGGTQRTHADSLDQPAGCRKAPEVLSPPHRVAHRELSLAHNMTLSTSPALSLQEASDHGGSTAQETVPARIQGGHSSGETVPRVKHSATALSNDHAGTCVVLWFRALTCGAALRPGSVTSPVMQCQFWWKMVGPVACETSHSTRVK